MISYSLVFWISRFVLGFAVLSLDSVAFACSSSPRLCGAAASSCPPRRNGDKTFDEKPNEGRQGSSGSSCSLQKSLISSFNGFNADLNLVVIALSGEQNSNTGY